MKQEVSVSYVGFLAGTAALGGLLFGFDIAIIAGAGPFLIEHFHLTDLSLGWAFSSLLFGCVLGSGVAGRLADRFGRRKVLLLVAVLFVVTSLMTGLASSFAGFVIARFLGGLAVGAVSLVSPMYISEVAPPAWRGRLGAFYQLSIVTGAVVSYFINYLLRNIGPDNWRWMFISGAIPAILFFVLLLRAPETPRFLLMAGDRTKAFEILTQSEGREKAESAVSAIMSTLTSKSSWRDLMRPGVRRAVGVSFVLAILVQVSGISTIVDYAPVIFRSAGWGLDAALFSTLVLGVSNFVFTLVSFRFIDHAGRKPMYIVGSLGMTVTLLLLAAAVIAGHFKGAAVLALILGYLAFFESCIGPVFWTVVPEIFPNSIRGTAMTVPVLTQWLANALVVLFFPAAFNSMGKAWTFGFLALMALAQAVCAWLFVPETKNKSLEEIEKLWTTAEALDA